jgi:hypothetical protein
VKLRAGSQETLPAATESDHISSGQEQVASQQTGRRTTFLQTSSLDALDLPMEIGGVFVFSHKKAQKHKIVCVGKRVKSNEGNLDIDIVGST